MAEELRKEDGLEVGVVKGSFLELSVDVDGEKAVETNPLWYPLPSTVVRETREFLGRQQG